MIVRVKSSVHGDDGSWRAVIWEHPDEYEICVVDPVKVGIGFSIETLSFEHFYATVCCGNVWIELIVGIF
jgi:hypothetical protein